MEYDATSCYDRIIPNFSAYDSQRLGLHEGDCSFVTRLLHSLQNKLVIGGKITESFFSDYEPFSVYGSSQGECLPPFVWTSIDDIILKTMKRHNQGMNYISPYNTISVMNTILYIVDDTNWVENTLGMWKHDKKRVTEL